VDAQAEYIFRLLMQAVAEIDLETEDPKLFDGDTASTPSSVISELGRLLGSALHDYYL